MRPHRLLACVLIATAMPACGDPLAPFAFEATFALPASVEVPGSEPGQPSTWVVAETLLFRADGTGAQWALTASQGGGVNGPGYTTPFRYARLRSRLTAHAVHPCHPFCDVVPVTWHFEIVGDELRGRIGRTRVTYRRVPEALAP